MDLLTPQGVTPNAFSAVASTHLPSSAASPGETPHPAGGPRRLTGTSLGSFLNFAPHGSFRGAAPHPTGFDASADDRFVASQRRDDGDGDGDLLAAPPRLAIAVGDDDDDDDDDDEHSRALLGPQSVDDDDDDDDELSRGMIGLSIGTPMSPSRVPPSLFIDFDVDGEPQTPCASRAAAEGETVPSAASRGLRRGRGLTEIADGVLFLGSYRDTVDADECRRLGVGAFLCVAAGCAPPPHAVQSGAPALCLPLQDDATERLADHVPAACAFIEAQAAAGRRTAIFCRKGRSRSVSLAIAFLMRRTGMSGQEALDFVAARYDRAEPNFAFLRQLGVVSESN